MRSQLRCDHDKRWPCPRLPQTLPTLAWPLLSPVQMEAQRMLVDSESDSGSDQDEEMELLREGGCWWAGGREVVGGREVTWWHCGAGVGSHLRSPMRQHPLCPASTNPARRCLSLPRRRAGGAGRRGGGGGAAEPAGGAPPRPAGPPAESAHPHRVGWVWPYRCWIPENA